MFDFYISKILTYLNIVLLFYTILDDLPKTKKYVQEQQESDVRGISF